MFDKKDKTAIRCILATSIVTNLIWMAVFLQHHREWERYCDKLLAFCNEINDMWYKTCWGGPNE